MIEIGQVIANREVYSIHENSYCIAKSVVPSPEPFTVWNIDVDGEGVHTGRYFKEKMDAEWCYAGLCFPWFEDNVHINMIEDGQQTLVQKLMKEVEYAKASVFPRQSLYEVYGRIKMARDLNAITKDEFFALNHAGVYDGINNPKYFNQEHLKDEQIDNIKYFEYVVKIFNDNTQDKGNPLTPEQREKLIELSLDKAYRNMDNISFLQKAYPLIFNFTT